MRRTVTSDASDFVKMLKAMPEKTSTRKVKICQQENTAIGWTRQSERSLLSPTYFFPAPTPRSERLEQAFRALTGDIFCCTYVSCAKKNLLYTISFSARVSLALLSLRKNRGLFVVYISFKVHVILSLMRGRGILQNAE